nr:hypothetical protein MmNV_49 [Menippe mercenaria nudivirus]
MSLVTNAPAEERLEVYIVGEHSGKLKNMTMKHEVELQPNEHYSIEIYNNCSCRAICPLQIAGAEIGRFVIPSYGRMVIDRPADTDRKFQFIVPDERDDLTKQQQAILEKPNANLVVIGRCQFEKLRLLTRSTPNGTETYVSNNSRGLPVQMDCYNKPKPRGLRVTMDYVDRGLVPDGVKKGASVLSKERSDTKYCNVDSFDTQLYTECHWFRLVSNRPSTYGKTGNLLVL